MRRRHLLRIGGTGSATIFGGCLFRDAVPGGTTGPAEDPPDDRPEGFWRWVNLVGVDGTDERIGVAFELAVTQPWITEEKTARLDAVLTNKGDVARRFLPLVLHSMTPERAGIELRSDADSPEAAPEPWCTGGDGKASDPGGESGGGAPSVLLEPGESVETAGYVVDDREARGCFPSGVYRFRAEQSVKVEEGSETRSHEIEFSVGVQGENG